MKEGPHQWPSGAATRKYCDRAYDRLTVRIDRLVERNRVLAKQLHDLKAWIVEHIS